MQYILKKINLIPDALLKLFKIPEIFKKLNTVKAFNAENFIRIGKLKIIKNYLWTELIIFIPEEF